MSRSNDREDDVPDDYSRMPVKKRKKQRPMAAAAVPALRNRENISTTTSNDSQSTNFSETSSNQSSRMNFVQQHQKYHAKQQQKALAPRDTNRPPSSTSSIASSTKGNILAQKILELEDKKMRLDSVLSDISAIKEYRGYESADSEIIHSARIETKAVQTMREAGQLLDDLEVQRKHKKLEIARNKMADLRAIQKAYNSAIGDLCVGEPSPDPPRNSDAENASESSSAVAGEQNISRDSEYESKLAQLRDAEAQLLNLQRIADELENRERMITRQKSATTTEDEEDEASATQSDSTGCIVNELAAAKTTQKHLYREIAKKGQDLSELDRERQKLLQLQAHLEQLQEQFADGSQSVEVRGGQARQALEATGQMLRRNMSTLAEYGGDDDEDEDDGGYDPYLAAGQVEEEEEEVDDDDEQDEQPQLFERQPVRGRPSGSGKYYKIYYDDSIAPEEIDEEQKRLHDQHRAVTAATNGANLTNGGSEDGDDALVKMLDQLQLTNKLCQSMMKDQDLLKHMLHENVKMATTLASFCEDAKENGRDAEEPGAAAQQVPDFLAMSDSEFQNMHMHNQQLFLSMQMCYNQQLNQQEEINQLKEQINYILKQFIGYHEHQEINQSPKKASNNLPITIKGKRNFDIDSCSVQSMASTFVANSETNNEGPVVVAASATPDNMFDNLRETIYSEVATLIAQNEAKPHFLVELFRELQMLNSDYLRQRALYSIQELVTSYLTEDRVKHVAQPHQEVIREVTPTESYASDDDYFKKCEESASVSDIAFARDDLDNTAIKLGDQLRTAKQTAAAASSSDASSSRAAPPSEQDLDTVIKKVMSAVIPHLKQSMNEPMREEFLTALEQQLVEEVDNELRIKESRGSEFAQFFQRQLSAVLSDAVSKYQGRKISDCGETLLFDVSEILFNELAFFRLMQDLDPNSEIPDMSTDISDTTGGNEEIVTSGAEVSQDNVESDEDDEEDDCETLDDEEEDRLDDGEEMLCEEEENEDAAAVADTSDSGEEDEAPIFDEDEQQDAVTSSDFDEDADPDKDQVEDDDEVEETDDDDVIVDGEADDNYDEIDYPLTPSETRQLRIVGSDEDENDNEVHDDQQVGGGDAQQMTAVSQNDVHLNDEEDAVSSSSARSVENESISGDEAAAGKDRSSGSSNLLPAKNVMLNGLDPGTIPAITTSSDNESGV